MNDTDDTLGLKLRSKEDYDTQVIREMFPNIDDIIVDFPKETHKTNNEIRLENWGNWSLDMFDSQEETE